MSQLPLTTLPKKLNSRLKCKTKPTGKNQTHYLHLSFSPSLYFAISPLSSQLKIKIPRSLGRGVQRSDIVNKCSKNWDATSFRAVGFGIRFVRDLRISVVGRDRFGVLGSLLRWNPCPLQSQHWLWWWDEGVEGFFFFFFSSWFYFKSKSVANLLELGRGDFCNWVLLLHVVGFLDLKVVVTIYLFLWETLLSFV